MPVFNILRTVIIVRRSKTSSSDSVSSLHFILTLRSLSYLTSRLRTFSSTLSLIETQRFPERRLRGYLLHRKSRVLLGGAGQLAFQTGFLSPCFAQLTRHFGVGFGLTI